MWEKLCHMWALGALMYYWPPLYDENPTIRLSQHLLLAPALYAHSHDHQHTASFYVLSLTGFLQGGRFLRMVINNHSNKWLRSYCFMALLRCTRGSQSRAVSKSTGINCVSVSHEVLHLFPSLRREHSCPCLSTHTQFTKHNSQISSKQGECLNQSVKHLPSKHKHRIHSSLTLLLADSSPS